MKRLYCNKDWPAICAKADFDAKEHLSPQERSQLETWPMRLENYLDSLSKKERAEVRKILNMRTPKEDVLHREHLLPIDITVLERAIEPSEYGDLAALAKAIPEPDYLDLMKRSYLEDRNRRFRDKHLEVSYRLLKEAQRKVVNWSVGYEVKTSQIAKHTGTSDRNIRQLRQRGVNNLRKRYAESVWDIPYSEITHAQYLFLQWYEDGAPEKAEPDPLRNQKGKSESWLAQYNRLCGECGAWMPAPTEVRERLDKVPPYITSDQEGDLVWN